MTNRFLPLLLLLVGFFSCATANKAHQALGGNWQLTHFPAGGKQFAETAAERQPEISFNMAEKRVSGSTGCNRFFGPYSLTKNRLSVGSNLGLTKMGCPEYDEQVFLNALHRVNNFTVNGNQLQLLQDKEVLMTFSRRP